MQQTEREAAAALAAGHDVQEAQPLDPDFLDGDDRAQAVFEQYRSRLRPEVLQIPKELREGARPPETWPYSTQSWQAIAEAAREYLRLKPLYDFAFGVAVGHFHVDELATGELRPGARVNAVTGKVVRPPESTIAPDTEARGRRALGALSDRYLIIDPVLQQSLEQAASGRYTSQPRGAEAAIAAAESAISRFDAERRAAADKERRKPLLRVRFAFRAMGRNYPVGEHRISAEEAEELTSWMDRKLAQAKQRDWDAPSGFSPDSWPPFSLEAPKCRD